MTTSKTSQEYSDESFDILQQTPRKETEVIPALQLIQQSYGYLPAEALKFVAAQFEVPLVKVTGIATFYSQFYLQPQGKQIIKVCQGTACHVQGADSVLVTLEEELEVVPGEVTEDDLFTLTSVRCPGCCSLAPVIMIDDNTYGNLTKEKPSPPWRSTDNDRSKLETRATSRGRTPAIVSRPRQDPGRHGVLWASCRS